MDNIAPVKSTYFSTEAVNSTYFNQGFFSYRSNTILEFTGYETLEKHINNCKRFPDHWVYRDKLITYNYNNFGHRCKNSTEIDYNNYILFTGCSFTEGVGLSLENTYCYLVSKELNTDYYNLGLHGTGDDILLHNLIVWNSKAKLKPKLVVVQYSDELRSSCLSKTTIYPKGPWVKDRILNDFFISGDKCGYFSARRILLNNMIDHIFNDIPIIKISSIEFQKLDFARDLVHPGIKSNRHIADYVIDIIKTKYSNEITNNTTRGEV